MMFKDVEWQTGKAYWLASRGVYAISGRAYFGPGVVYAEDGGTRAGIGYGLFNSNGNESFNAFAVRPVASINCGYAITDCMRDNIETNCCPFARNSNKQK